MTGAMRLLVDVREDDNLRGFHVLASLHLIASQLGSVKLYLLGGNRNDEKIAVQAFSFDTGLRFHGIWSLVLVDSKFDVYLSAANILPLDRVSIAARATSRRAILALMFDEKPIACTIPSIMLDGHDTANIACKLSDVLRWG